MLRRFTPADWAATIGAALGLVAVYLPWYSYSSGAARVTVNGFRASLLGDLFFLALAAAVLLLLTHRGYIDHPLARWARDRAAFPGVAATAGAVVILQLILMAAGGRSVAGGFILAVVATLALALSAWLRRRDADPAIAPGGASNRDLLTD
jgi:hypothetical protein